jgi:dUTPase
MKKSNLSVKYKLLSEKAKPPTLGHSTDSGWDLHIIGIEKVVGDVIFFKTGVSVQPPSGYYFELFPRSSISNLPISLANSVGVIDESYTGEVLVAARVHHSDMGRDARKNSYPNGIVDALGFKPQNIMSFAELVVLNKPKIAQLVLKKRIDCTFVNEELEETERGSGGFGSTDLEPVNT